jgi:tRNA threonylcarbamoyladenosine biosynthesis protein TsaB
MAYLLSIDASTVGCSVAVFQNSNLLACQETQVERSAAELLTTMIAEVTAQANIKISDLAAIAVAKGPGSYTGLRIAVSTAKGLSFGLDLPLISYSTLDGLVQQVKDKSVDFDLLCPMLDARRLEVYCALYDANSLLPITDITAEILHEKSFSELLKNKKVLFFGEGSEKCKSIFTSLNAKYLEEIIYPSAKYSGDLIFKKYQDMAFEDLILFEPFYLKEYMFKTKKP